MGEIQKEKKWYERVNGEIVGRRNSHAFIKSSQTTHEWSVEDIRKQLQAKVEGRAFNHADRLRMITNWFRKFDADGNGSLDKRELHTVVRVLISIHMTNTQTNQLFRAIDVDQDGTIQRDESLDFVLGDRGALKRSSTVPAGQMGRRRAKISSRAAKDKFVAIARKSRPPVIGD